jgi:hypothetical protein
VASPLVRSRHMLGRGPVAVGTAGRKGVAPATPPRNRLPHPAAARSQRDWRDHVPALAQQHALAGAAACLLLGASATAATAATFPPGWVTDWSASSLALFAEAYV